MIKLSDYVIQFVASQGVKHVFLVPGGGAMHLNDSLGRCPEIEYVCNLHEQASSIAAEAYAKVTNNLGVAMVTTGPAGTNAVTGVAGAYLDSMPCLFLSGQVKRADLKRETGVRQLGVQEVDIVTIVGSITKYAVTILDPATIRYHLEKGVHLARSGRPGPVWIDIPLDVQAAQIDETALPGFTPEPAPPGVGTQLAGQARAVVAKLRQAQRPAIIAGNGIRIAGAIEAFHRVLRRVGIPVLPTWLGIDLIADDDPLFAGRPGAIAPRGANFALQNSDLLLVLGSRLDMALTGYAHDRFARAASKIMVDIDPAEIQKMNTPIDLAIEADVLAFLLELEKALEGETLPSYDAWAGRCREWKERYPVVQPEHRRAEDKVSVYHFSETLSKVLREDDVVVSASSGSAVELFLLSFRTKANQRVFHTRGLGSMGFGLPAAIAACLAAGRRRTVCVDGDGGFQMNIQELETVARLGLPIKFFVVNNDGYASIRSSQQRYFNHLVAADRSSGLTLPDLMKLATAYGLPGVRIENQENLEEKIRSVLETAGPVLCEIMSPAGEISAPKLSSAQRADGSMVSKPLEDLWPFLEREEFHSNMIIPVLEE